MAGCFEKRMLKYNESINLITRGVHAQDARVWCASDKVDMRAVHDDSINRVGPVRILRPRENLNLKDNLAADLIIFHHDIWSKVIARCTHGARMLTSRQACDHLATGARASCRQRHMINDRLG